MLKEPHRRLPICGNPVRLNRMPMSLCFYTEKNAKAPTPNSSSQNNATDLSRPSTLSLSVNAPALFPRRGTNNVCIIPTLKMGVPTAPMTVTLWKTRLLTHASFFFTLQWKIALHKLKPFCKILFFFFVERIDPLLCKTLDNRISRFVILCYKQG